MKRFVITCLIAAIVVVLAVSSSLAVRSLQGSSLPASRGQALGPSSTSAAAPLASAVKKLCGPFTGLYPGGIYKGGFGGAYLEDEQTGNLYWCAKGTVHLIAEASLTSDAYEHMAGVVNKTYGLVLVLDNAYPTQAGFWFCYGATSSYCSSQSSFFSLPAAFCGYMPTTTCSPDGIALDGKLNVWYVDGANKVVVRCLALGGYQHCKVLEKNLSDFPDGLYRDAHGNLWVTDADCYGYIWLNGVLQYTLSDRLGAITMSSANPSKTLHTYFAVEGGCGTFTFSFIYDLTDHTIVTPYGQPFTSTTTIFGLSTQLQFTDLYGAVYQATDTA